jgi:hypothetical protein
MSIMLLFLPNGQQVMGEVVEETDNFITMEYPINIVMTNPVSPTTAVYTSRYSPLAKDSLVSFNKNSIVSFSNVDDNLIKHYDSMVDHYKTKEFTYISDRDNVEEDEDEEHQEIYTDDQADEEEYKSKTFH